MVPAVMRRTAEDMYTRLHSNTFDLALHNSLMSPVEVDHISILVPVQRKKPGSNGLLDDDLSSAPTTTSSWEYVPCRYGDDLNKCYSKEQLEAVTQADGYYYTRVRIVLKKSSWCD